MNQTELKCVEKIQRALPKTERKYKNK